MLEARRVNLQRRADMLAHDRLPVVVRKALGRTIRKWSSVSALECIEQHGMSPDATARMILTMDQEHAFAEGGGRQNPSHAKG